VKTIKGIIGTMDQSLLTLTDRMRVKGVDTLQIVMWSLAALSFFFCVFGMPIIGGMLDPDHDGLASKEDNCNYVHNPEQENSDWPPPVEGTASGSMEGTGAIAVRGDRWGDACDLCTEVANTCSSTSSHDITTYWQCDEDDDGVGDQCDNCPYISNWDQTDSDGDGRGDACPFSWDRINRLLALLLNRAEAPPDHPLSWNELLQLVPVTPP
jgi:hypothetical protein